MRQLWFCLDNDKGATYRPVSTCSHDIRGVDWMLGRPLFPVLVNTYEQIQSAEDPRQVEIVRPVRKRYHEKSDLVVFSYRDTI